MRGLLALTLALALTSLTACGSEPPIGPEEVALRIDIGVGVGVAAGAGHLEPGRSFPVRVVRSWSKRLEPTPFAPRSLRPLTLVPEGVARRESATHVEETLAFRGYAFARSDVTVPASAFAARPRDSGPAQVASAPGQVLRVRPTLDARAPGEAELPDAPPRAPGPWRSLALAALGVLLAVLLLRRRRARAPAAPPTPAPDAALQAAAARAAGRAQLESLATRPAVDAAQRAARLLEAAATVRATLSAVDPSSAARTATELGAVARTRGDRRLRGAARLVLAPAERVTFAREAPDALRLTRVLAASRAALAEEGVP